MCCAFLDLFCLQVCNDMGHVSYIYSQSIEDLWLSEYVDIVAFLTSLASCPWVCLRFHTLKKYLKERKRQIIIYMLSLNNRVGFSEFTNIMTVDLILLGEWGGNFHILLLRYLQSHLPLLFIYHWIKRHISPISIKAYVVDLLI